MGSSRIRLEGRLEKVERAVLQLERGLEAARRHDFGPLAAAITVQESAEVREACEHVQKMSGEDPSLGRVLDRLWKLVRVADKRVVARGVKLRMMPAPLAQAARQLADEPVLFGGRPDRRWLLAALMIVSMVSVMLWSTHGGMFPFIFVLLARVPWLQAIDVVVTTRRALFGDEIVDLADVKRAAFRNGTLTFELHDGVRKEQRVPEPAPALVAALKTAGVEVDISVGR